MAGLLDIFGTSGADTMGLLGMSPSDIRQNRDDAQAQALYALAGRLFQGGNTGASIAQGLQAGQQAYKTGMQNALQDQLQNVQLQEMLKKRQEEQMAKQLFMRGYKPATAGIEAKPFEEDGRYLGETPAVAAQPSRFDISSVAPELIALGGTGQAYLKNALDLQQAMGGKTHVLAEGGTLVRENPLTGKTEIVASGAPKKEDIAGDVKEARQILGITTPVNEMTMTERALVRAYIDRKDTNKSPKVSVDLKDPTAVAKAQLETMNKWEGYLKNSGDDVVANRLRAFNDAYRQSKNGNASGDGAMLYNLAKIYDSSGAVQANDINAIIGSRSIPTQITLAAQKFKSGGTFTPEERANLQKIATGIATERQKQLTPSLDAYRKLNKRLGAEDFTILDPYERVLNPPSLDNILGK